MIGKTRIRDAAPLLIAISSFYLLIALRLVSIRWQYSLAAVICVAVGFYVAVRTERNRRQRERLVREHAVLRTLATLVARGAEPDQVFSAAATGLAELLGADMTRIFRFDPGPSLRIVADNSGLGIVGTRWEADGPTAVAEVFRTGRVARVDDYVPNRRELTRQYGAGLAGVRAAVACPVIVNGALWGAVVVLSRTGPLPKGTEVRMGECTELLGIAIANADSRAKFIASRARIVTATDSTRRAMERDLHDGVQQRLVSLALDAGVAVKKVPSELTELRATLTGMVADIAELSAEVREISHGIYPAVLSQDGLGRALRALARRSNLPVTISFESEQKLPRYVEEAAYYVVAEALTNAMKHADAASVQVILEVTEAELRITVSDNGIGGADPTRGSGLIGLSDRIEALGGSIYCVSPQGVGTTLDAALPLALVGATGTTTTPGRTLDPTTPVRWDTHRPEW